MKARYKTAISLVTALLLLATPSIHAQASTESQPSAQASTGPIFKTSVRNVVLDVIVTDKAGHPVTNLQRGDFRIVEDGTPQAVQFFQPPSAEASQQASSDSGRAILVLDELNSKFEDLAFAVSSVQKLLDRTPRLPQPTALMLLSDRGIRVLAGYTQDGAALSQALRRHQHDISINLRDATMPFSEVVNLSLGAMEQLARANMDSGRRQSILWVTAGINSQAYEGALSTTNLADFIHALSLLSDEMLRSRTTLNAVDPQGVGNGRIAPIGILSGTQNGGSGSDAADFANTSLAGTSNLALGTLTGETGGAYLYGHNNVDAEALRVLSESAGAYTLAYSPTNHDYTGKFRKLKVELVPAGLIVRTRPGYFALPESATRDSAYVKYEINHAVTSQVNYQGITVSVQTGAPDADKLPLTIAVDPHSIQWELQDDGQYHGKVELVAVSFNARQKALTSVKQTRSAQIPAAGYQSALAKPWNIALTVPAEKGLSFVRVVVRDQNSDRIGSAQTALP